jgi:hypothetical protein
MSHLPPAHHETSKHDFPHETKIKVKQQKCPGFEFKHQQINDSSQSNEGTDNLVSQKPIFCSLEPNHEYQARGASFRPEIALSNLQTKFP